MADDRIIIDDIELNIASGKPFNYIGDFTKKDLVGIELKFSVTGQDNIDLIEDLT